MKHEAFLPEQAWLSVILCESMDDLNGFEGQFLKQRPYYEAQTDPSLINYKPGFLKKYRSATEVLAGNLPKAEQKQFLSKFYSNASALDIGYIVDRAPRALSNRQKLLMSLEYYVLTGRKLFLLRAVNGADDQQWMLRFAQWLRSYSGGNGSVVMLISCSREELDKALIDTAGDGAMLYKLSEGNLTDLDAAIS